MERLTTQDSADLLIRRLTEDLRPVSRITRTKALLFLGGLFVLFVSILAGAAFSPRPDLASRAQHTIFVGMLLWPIFIAALGAVLILTGSLLGAERKDGKKTLILFMLISYLAVTLIYSWQVKPVHLGFVLERQDLNCAMLVFLLALPIWFVAGITGILFFPRSKSFLNGVSLLAMGAALFVMNMHCPFDGRGHHLLGHGLIPFVFIAATSPLVTLLINRLVQKWIETRVRRKEVELSKL